MELELESDYGNGRRLREIELHHGTARSICRVEPEYRVGTLSWKIELEGIVRRWSSEFTCKMELGDEVEMWSRNVELE